MTLLPAMDAGKTSGLPLSAIETPVEARGEALMRRPHSWRHLSLVAIVCVAIAVCLCFLVLVTVLRKSKVQPSSENIQPFCCPDETLMIWRAVNRSIDPCDDFYGYVCSRADAGSSKYSSPLFRIAMEWVFVDLDERGQRRSAAAVMFDSLTKVIMEREHPPGDDIAQYVKAIVAITTPLRQMDSFHTVRFFGLLSLRYGLPSIVSFSVSRLGTVLNGTRNACFSDSANESELTSAIEAVKETLNISVSVQEFLRFKDEVASALATNTSKELSQPIHVSPFFGLSNLEWRNIVKEVVLPVYPNVTSFATREDDRLSDFVDILGNKTSHAVTLVYSVVCTALKAWAAMEGATISTWMRRTRTIGVQSQPMSCQPVGLCEIEHAFMAEAVSSPAKNKHITAMFAAIRDKVAHEASLHPLFRSTAEEELGRRLRLLRVVLPEDIAVSDIPVPTASESFAANVLAANSYAFDVRAARLARKIPEPDSLVFPTAVRQGDVIFLPTNLFALLGRDPGRNKALDLAVAGVDIAARLWSFLLESSWPGWTRRNIDARLQCFRESYFNGSDSDEYLSTVTAALGISSALDAMTTPEWSVVSYVNDRNISLGRLMYLMWAYNRCAAVPDIVVRLDVNVALRNSHGFRQAFKCPQQSPMAEPSCCLGIC